MRGVRPNSPIQMMAVSSSSPRSSRSATSALIALSSSGSLVSCSVREVVGVRVPAAQIDFDERHALLDQPAGHQAAAAEAGLAVPLAALLRLSWSTLKASICLLVISADGLFQNLGVVLRPLGRGLA